MIKYIFVVWLCFFGTCHTFAQNCGVNTTTPTVNVWDWRQEFWEIYANGTVTIPNPIRSPFYDLDSRNTFNLAAFIEKDNKVEDGWELITRNLGTPSQPTPQPYVVLYNKYTSKIRVFFLIVQLYSQTSTQNVAGDAKITINFLNEPSFPYQSNLFTAIETPLKPLDKFERNIAMTTPNYFQNFLPYWLYADFAVAYDPCPCYITQKSVIRISSSLLSSEKIEFTLNAQPYKKTVSAGKVEGDFLTSVKDLGSMVDKGLKAADKFGNSLSEVDNAVKKQTGLSALKQLQLNQDYQQLAGLVESGKGWVKLIPKVGEIASSVLGLIDFFSSGGKKSGESPAASIIANNFKANGDISSASNTNDVEFALPGSNQVGLNTRLIPTYNNTLGVFNLLTTPTITPERFQILQPRNVEVINSGCTSQGELCEYEATYATRDEFRYYKIASTSNIEYVVNNALNIDLPNSDIQAALVFEDAEKVINTNLISEVESKGKDIYRTEYYPIGKIKDVTARIRFESGKQLAGVTYTGKDCSCASIPSFIPTNIDVKVYLKVIVRLRRNGETDDKTDIIFIAKYPVNLNNSTTRTTQLAISNPQIIYNHSGNWNVNTNGIIVLPTFGRAIFTNSTITTATSQATFQAPQIELVATGTSETTTFTTNSQGIIVFEAKNIAYQPPASPTRISSFCNDAGVYKIPSRITFSREISPEMTNPYEQDNSVLSAFPNPTQKETTITYTLTESDNIKIYVSNLMGEKILDITNISQTLGKHSINVKTDSLPAGIYFYTLETSKGKLTKRLVILE